MKDTQTTWLEQEISRKYHETASLFPLMQGADFEKLKADIVENGLLEAICVHPNGSIIDGRNRHRACIETETHPRFRTWDGQGSLVSFVVSMNLHRRHLTSSQMAVVALDIQKRLKEESKNDRKTAAKQAADERWTRERLGKELFQALRPHLKSQQQAHQEKIAGRRAKQQVYFIQDGNRVKIGVSVDPKQRLQELSTGNYGISLIGSCPGGIDLERELHHQFKEHNIGGEWYHLTEEVEHKINDLMRIVNLDKMHTEQATNTRKEAARIAGVSAGYVSDAKKLQQDAPDLLESVKDGELTIPQAKREFIKRTKIEAPPLPTDKYRVLYADPPWKYGNAGIIGETDHYGHTERHYPSMSIEELCTMGSDIKEMSESNAVLFLWVTSPLLEECFPVINAWGFKYKTSFVWDKIQHNYGHYNSVRHELLLICTRGSCTPDIPKLFDSVQSIEKSSKHSEKPEEFRDIIDTLYTYGKKIELFARKETGGWDTWGNESTG